jgi:hypothetical protein
MSPGMRLLSSTLDGLAGTADSINALESFRPEARKVCSMVPRDDESRSYLRTCVRVDRYTRVPPSPSVSFPTNSPFQCERD